MTSAEEILAQSDNFSQLSATPSFTLSDILKQPPNQYEDQQIIDDVDKYFMDDDEQPEQIQPYDMSQRIASQSPLIETYSQNINVRDESIKSKTRQSLQQNVVKKHSRLKDLPLIPREQIQNMTYTSLKNVTQLFDIAQIKGVGVATCISSTGSRFLAVGTSLGNIALFQIGIKGYRTLTTQQRGNNSVGQVTSVAVSRDSRYLVAGYESGLIAIWELNGFKTVKQEIIRSARIVKVLFCSDNFQNFIVNDALGFLHMFTIENKFWVTIHHRLLIDRDQNKIYYDIKYTKLQSGRQIVALCSLDSVVLISLKPNIGIIEQINRPQTIKSDKIPNCQLGISDDKDILCISWGKTIFLYRLIPTNYSMQNVVFNHKIEHPTTIHNLEFIAKNMLITVDDSQIYRVINLVQSFQTNSCVIVNTYQMEIETIYQRFLKDKKGKWIKLYSNTMMNCSFDPKNKQIFFIVKNAIYRGRLQKWTSIVHNMLSEQKNWLQALKICLQLKKGSLNIFLQPFILTKTTKQLLCDIGKIFLKEKMTEIRSKNPDQTSIKAVRSDAQQIFQITVQYFLTIQCEEYLFDTIFCSVIKESYYYEYYELLIQSIEPFIQHKSLKRIPHYGIFLQILQKYSNKPELINKLVTSLDQKSLHYQDLVQICAKQKLYESLCYICAMNGDFISPANKILTKIHTSMHQNRKINIQPVEKQKNYTILKNYIENLVELKYPNGKQIVSDKRVNALQEIQLWISSKQTLFFFINQYPDDLFMLLSKLSVSLIKFHLEHYLIDLCQQLVDNVEKPQINKQQQKQQNIKSLQESQKQIKSLQRLLKFLIKCGLFNEIHYYHSLIKNILEFQFKIYTHATNYGRQSQVNNLNLTQGLKFIEKYLLPIKKKALNNSTMQQEQSQLIYYFEQKIRNKLNIHIQAYYLLASSAFEKQDANKKYPSQLIFQEEKIQQQILRNYQGNQKNQLTNYFLKQNQDLSFVKEKYLSLFMQWSPEPAMIYILENFGLQKVNSQLKLINEQKYRYLIVRKILKLLRKSGNQQNVPKITKKKSKAASVIFQTTEYEGSESVKSSDISQQPKLQKQIMISYILSMCKYKKEKRIFYELKQNPSDYSNFALQLLPILQKFKLKSCQAIMLQYQLHFKDSFNLYTQVYEEYFQMNFKKLVSHEHCHGRFMASIFHTMLELCYRIRKQNQWTTLVRAILSPLEQLDALNAHKSRGRKIKIIDTIQKIYDIKSTRDHPFIHELQDVIQATIISASRQISIEMMALQLNKYSDLLSKTFILNCLSSTLNNSYKRVESFEISKSLMVIQYINNFVNFYRNSKIIGKSIQQICSKCQQSIIPNKQKLIVLSCGHGYHLNCINQYSHLSHIINSEASTKCQICSRVEYGDPLQENIFTQTAINQPQQWKGITDEEAQAIDKKNIHNVYKCMAFDDYMDQQDQEFEAFRIQYEKNILLYRNY